MIILKEFRLKRLKKIACLINPKCDVKEIEKEKIKKKTNFLIYTRYLFIFFLIYNKTSLYDKYHSNVNIDYIWNILSQVVYKETNEDIKDNNDYKQIFIENSKNIFKRCN